MNAYTQKITAKMYKNEPLNFAESIYVASCLIIATTSSKSESQNKGKEMTAVNDAKIG